VDQTERTLWTVRVDTGSVACVMRSCCAGAELQILTATASGESTIVLRELYPSKSDLYERARLLEAHYRNREDQRNTAASTS
jgi:hypothetical protein